MKQYSYFCPYFFPKPSPRKRWNLITEELTSHYLHQLRGEGRRKDWQHYNSVWMLSSGKRYYVAQTCKSPHYRKQLDHLTVNHPEQLDNMISKTILRMDNLILIRKLQNADSESNSNPNHITNNQTCSLLPTDLISD